MNRNSFIALLIIATFFMGIGFVIGNEFSGIRVVRDDGTVCAEVR